MNTKIIHAMNCSMNILEKSFAPTVTMLAALVETANCRAMVFIEVHVIE